MIEVEVNGIVHEFPEGTSRDVIRNALKRKYSSAQESPQMQASPERRQIASQQVTPGPSRPSVARTLLDQGLQGATFGFSDEITDRMGAGIASLVTGQPYSELLPEARRTTQESLDDQLEQRPLLSIGANIIGGLGTAIPAGATGAGASVGNFLRTGNAAMRIAKGAGAGAASGALYGAGTGEDGERLESASKGAIAGGVVGAAAPAVGMAARGAYNTVVPAIDDTTAALAKRARNFKIPLRADQVLPTKARRTVQKASQVLPLSGASNFESAQRTAWNKALANTIGVDDLGPSSIKVFRRRNSRMFEDVLKNKQVQFADEDIAKIQALKGKIDNTLGITDRDAKILIREVDGLVEDLADKSVSGKKLSNLRSNLLEKATGAGRGSRIFDDAISTLDDVAAKNSTAEEVSKLATARKHYKSFKIMQPLLEESTDGEINPTKLLTRVKSNRYIDASTIETGEDDLVDLARIGKQFLPIQGGSDTFDKTVLGALTVGTAFDPLTTAAIAGGLGLNRGLQGVVTNQRLIDASIRSASRPQSQVFNNPLLSIVGPSLAP